MPVIDLGSVVGPQGPQGAAGATGAQGIQGNPGPNQVTDQTSTNLNGVLFGSQSRVTGKPIDSDPTADSMNPVSSGGVKAALDGKAAKADLTSIQATGTTNTTGAAIPAGAYFYLNGILYQAKTQIDVNATFTVNTNCEQVTEGGLNELKAAITLSAITHGTPVTVAYGTVSYDFYVVGELVFLSGSFTPSANITAAEYVDFTLNDLPKSVSAGVFSSVSTISSSNRTPTTQIQALSGKTFRLSGAQTSGRSGQFFGVFV